MMTDINHAHEKVSQARWDYPTASRRQTFFVTLAISIFLTLISFITPLLGIDFFQMDRQGHRLLNVSIEGNIPTWWSATLLAVGGLSFLVRACALRAAKGWKKALPEGVVGLILVAMSIDDMSGIHEHLFWFAQRIAPNLFAYNWLLIGIPIGIAVMVVVGFSVVHLPSEQRKMVLLGFLVFFSGALGLEGVGSAMASQGHHLGTAGTIVYHAEEFVEMCGAAILALAGLSTPGRARAGFDIETPSENIQRVD